MSSIPVDHNAEIAAAAKSVLEPVGCMRKGRSRTWLADHGWWVAVVEFQPSAWAKGSYLNVGASYLWKPVIAQSSLSFDAVIGPRPWYDAMACEPFMPKAMELASIARDSLTGLREHQRTIALAAEWLQREWIERSPWRNYHLGVALGLSGKVDCAQRHFRLVVDPPSGYEWVKVLARECEAYAALVEDRSAFKFAVLERIRAMRGALKFPPVDLEQL
jgi:hypothetical protein